MFVLVEMTDTVRIPPWQFERKLNESIAEELNKKLANKVVYNVGLCICLYDITKLEDSYIFPGDGASHTKVHFRYVVFHPFLDEILIGEIKSCSQDGVHGKLGRSANQAWASCRGGRTASCSQSLLRSKAFRWIFGGLRDPAGARCSFEAERELRAAILCFPVSFQPARSRQSLSRNAFADT
uniref:DNA-directed RNA polymerase subunit n=1 Tax=Anser brachyrhynchus TaxID=132585 RepID=A0A8B9BIX4_9AVES